MFHPGGGYPDMERDSVLYGGTDPGRFVPTYMIFCESRVSPKNRFRDPAFDRSDVYIITQNALADNTYMSYIRDQYDVNRPTNNTTMLQRWLGRDHVYPKAPIFIPKPEDSAMAFQKYVEDVQAGRRPQNADLKIDNGRVEVSGALGVMEINGILAQWIFEKNKDKHAFYVEESYAIQWMYPYMRPFGVILKLEKDPVPSPQANPALWQDIIAKDKSYWDALTKEFLAREEFRRNNDAKKSFSKMRSAIAGLYLMRGLATEAEYAFKQSLDLCPESSESCFRLASLYMQEGRFGDARKLMEGYQALDPYNESVSGFLAQIADTVKNIQRRTELEQKLQKGGGDAGTAMELLAVYGNLNLQGPFASLATRLLQIENPPPAFLLQLAQVCGNGRRPDLAIEPLKRYLAREPYDAKIWIELAFAQQSANQLGDAFNSLRKAIETGGDTVRSLLRTDNRFTLMRQSPAFQALLQQAGASNLRLMQPMDSGKIGSPNGRN
jgi:tetratricopeptide (TPR) repeat protein